MDQQRTFRQQHVPGVLRGLVIAVGAGTLIAFSLAGPVAGAERSIRKYVPCTWKADDLSTFTCGTRPRKGPTIAIPITWCWGEDIPSPMPEELVGGSWVAMDVDVMVAPGDGLVCATDAVESSMTVALPTKPFVAHSYRITVPENETHTATVSEVRNACIRPARSTRTC